MISIKNFSFRYKGAENLSISNVSLDIPKGQCVLLSGRSGCGKTTLLRAMNGLIPHFYEGGIDGTVNVDGMNVMETPMYRLSEKIGTVYQNPRSQFFNIDTDSEISFGIENLAYPEQEIQRRINKTVNETHVEKLLGRNIFDLSGGEKQKIAFASIYAMEPDVFLLDEPSANLDAQSTEKLAETIRDLKSKGKTIVITEHRLYYLKDIIDRAIYIENGRIAEDFTEKQFFSLTEDKRKQMGLRGINLNDINIHPSSAKSSAVLSIENLSSGYKNHIVINNISFKASQSEIIAVTGSNGAGKSTFSETICGLHKKMSGTIILNGQELTEKQCNKLCYMVFQDVDYQLFADSVENECSYGQKNVNSESILNSLKSLSLIDYKERHPATLSGGQKQRLAVAVGTLCNKEIMVFDEPTSGLDLASMQSVASIVKNLAAQGKIIFIVTHDYELICECCNRIIRLEDSTIKEDYYLSQETTKRLKYFFKGEEYER